MRMSSFDRTDKRIIVLVAGRNPRKEAQELTITIPSTIQKGVRY